ncbi:MAG: hypothetical protein Q8K89_03745 [Actinomycetota bacterium]|nr:hypothetical protein [Actinomycetota bacterium]
MRDARVDVDETPPTDVAPRGARKRPSMLKDPAVMRMTYIAIGLVILFLVSVMGVLLSGVTSPSGPRTLAEREAAVSGEAVQAGSNDPAVWGQYIAALIASGQNTRARDVIEQGRESIDDSATAEFTLGEARLYAARKDHDKVLEAADAGMAQIQKAWDAAVSSGGTKAQAAKLDGLHDNYYVLALLKAESSAELGDWAKAIEQYDLYIVRNPGAADILIDRADAKIETGDTTGAEADFRKALEFIPDNPEARAGLEKIGAADSE